MTVKAMTLEERLKEGFKWFFDGDASNKRFHNTDWNFADRQGPDTGVLVDTVFDLNDLIRHLLSCLWQGIESCPREKDVPYLLKFEKRQSPGWKWTGPHIGPTQDYPPRDDPRWKEVVVDHDAEIALCHWVPNDEGGGEWERVGVDDCYYYPRGEPVEWMEVPGWTKEKYPL
jgi:hypothetical protein